MSEVYRSLLERTRAWFARAAADGWLDPADGARLEALERGTPGELFADVEARPLVVALFGGTGVGKSSLLNRLAGAPVARVGVERPTSREAIVYVHEAVELKRLPQELPVEKVGVRRHGVPRWRNVLWIDAPDIDSTNEENRRLALSWLPHVDLLIYVVSPERYRDDAGWRVLQARGQRHGWMFVLNRWDEGDVRQRDDFARLLREAGFESPLLLCTCCDMQARRLPSLDQFEQLEAAIAGLVQEHAVRELERLGQRVRLLELRAALAAALERLGDDETWQRLPAEMEQHWQRTCAGLRAGSEWLLRARAARLRWEGGLAVRARNAVSQFSGQARERPAAAPTGGIAPSAGNPGAPDPEVVASAPQGDVNALARGVWDAWAQGRVEECLDRVELGAARARLHPAPLRKRLDAAVHDAERLVGDAVQSELRVALARPGAAWQRGLRRVTGFLIPLLPTLALLWVLHNVVRGYWRASLGAGEWLGWSFAVHSLLLVLTALAVPLALDRLLKPSLEQAALRGLRRGLERGLEALGGRLRPALRDAEQQARRHREEGRALAAETARAALTPLRADSPLLSRVVALPPREGEPNGAKTRSA